MKNNNRTLSKKFELVMGGRQTPDPSLYRIRALRDFGNVKKGELGGYVESENNLSHEGNCWIADEASVTCAAHVSGNALVHGAATISGCVLVTDNANIGGWVILGGHAQIDGDIRMTAPPPDMGKPRKKRPAGPSGFVP